MLKKINVIILLYFIILASPLFSIEFYYKSNSLGMQFELIEPESIEEENYCLGIVKGLEKDILHLYTKGELIKEWELFYYSNGKTRQEIEYYKDELLYKRLYSGNGNLTEEFKYEKELVIEHSLYHYNNKNETILLELFNGEEDYIYKEEYKYTNSGLLREVLRTFSNDDYSIFSYNFGNGKLIDERTVLGEKLYVSRFNASGKLLQSEIWEGNTLEFRKTSVLSLWTGVVVSVTEEDFIKDIKTIKTFDKDGNLLEEKIVGETQAEKTFIHDSEGRIINERKIGENGVEEWEYEYNEEGSLEIMTYLIKGSIVSVRTYTDENAYYDELYRNGKPFIRTYYENDEKIDEEFIRETE